MKSARHGLRTFLVTGALVVVAALLPTESVAQDVPLAPPQDFEGPSGLKIGDFNLYNRLQFGLQSTDNIRQDPTEEHDFKTVMALNAFARSGWEKHALAFSASYVHQDAVDIDDQKSSAASGSVSGRYDFSDTLHISGGILHTEDIVGKNDPEQFSGNLNGTTIGDTAEMAIEWRGESFFVRTEGRFDEVANETDVNVSILSRVQSQDRREMDGTVQFGRKYSWGKAYIIGGTQRIRYTGSEVILPEDRDSDGGRGGLGLEFKHGSWLGIFRLFGFAQYYDASTIGPAIDYVGTAQLAYKIDDKLSVAGKVERSFDETNIETSAGLFTNLASIGLQHQFQDDAYIRLGPSYRFYQIEGTKVEATSYSIDLAAAWQVHPRVELVLNANYSNQLVNDILISNLQYNETAVTLSTVITF